MYNGSLADALQLTVPINCFSLLLLIAVFYLVYYIRTRLNLFKAGSIVTFNLSLFVLLEVIIIICGWYGNISLGRYLYRVEQIPVFMFSATLPYFIKIAMPVKDWSGRVMDLVVWIGMGVTAAVTVAVFLFPDSLILIESVTETAQISPDDLTRGLAGPIHVIRDIMLALAIIISLFYSVFYMIRNGWGTKNLSMFIAISIAVLGGIEDLQYLYTESHLIFKDLTVSRFIFGVTIMMLFFWGTILSRFLKTHNLLEKTSQNLAVKEGKYSLLLEATDEILFSLSRELKIIEANPKADRFFRLSGEHKYFFDCLYHNDYESRGNISFFKEQLIELRDAGETLSFNTYLMDPVTSEPIGYHFRFDCFNADDTIELIGRAWPVSASKLAKFITSEKLSLDVGNYITMVGDIVERLTSVLRHFLESSEVMMVKMGLNEMIVNAMEHGNLNITFDEKTRAQEEGRLFDFMKERRLLPEYRDKKVSIDYHIDESRAIYRITDMGSGFDYKKIMARVKDEVNQKELSHGRGILMTQTVFNKVEYNNKGNQVLLVKEFKK